MSKVSFTGGPLHEQKREMEVYVGLIPVHRYNDQSYGYDENGFPEAYYVNVNAVAGIDEQLRTK